MTSHHACASASYAAWVRTRLPLLSLLLLGACGRCDAPKPASEASTSPDAARATPIRSAGCDAGAADRPDEGERVSVRVEGVERSYLVAAARGDPNEARALIVAFHGSYSDGAKIRAHLDLEKRAGQRAVFVYPDGLTGHDAAAWNLTASGPDVAFVDAVLRDVEARRCIDTRAVFAVGFSYGGWMANALACARPGVLRGIASIEGGGPNVPCSGRVAAMIIHGSGDFDEPLTSGEATRDHWVEANGCSEHTRPSSPPECVAYEACAAGAPVVFCRHDGAHVVPDFASAAVWSFVDRLR